MPGAWSELQPNPREPGGLWYRWRILDDGSADYTYEPNPNQTPYYAQYQTQYEYPSGFPHDYGGSHQQQQPHVNQYVNHNLINHYNPEHQTYKNQTTPAQPVAQPPFEGQPRKPKCFQVVSSKKIGRFYVPGRVFKLVWSEGRGFSVDDNNTYTEDYLTMLEGYKKSRIFIVIHADAHSSTCLPIKTHTNRGTTKKGLNPNHFCQAYSKTPRPKLLSGEKPLKKLAIKIELENDDVEHLRDASRISLREVQTVQNNQPVQLIGKVPDKEFRRLRGYYNDVQKFKNEELEEDEVDEDEPMSGAQ